jgi:hypothetical protein
MHGQGLISLIAHLLVRCYCRYRDSMQPQIPSRLLISTERREEDGRREPLQTSNKLTRRSREREGLRPSIGSGRVLSGKQEKSRPRTSGWHVHQTETPALPRHRLAAHVSQVRNVSGTLHSCVARQSIIIVAAGDVHFTICA